jgi:uracil-DNA glycosylase
MDEAAGCTRYDLYERATQTVFAERAASAAITLAGEQPGEQEDKQVRELTGTAYITCITAAIRRSFRPG